MLTTPSTIRPGRIVLEIDRHSIVLPPGEVLLGRGEECFLRIDDPAVSRVHLKLVVGDTLVIEDLGSTNGTRVNGAPLRRRLELRGGDEISVGDRVYRVRMGDPAAEFSTDVKTPVTVIQPAGKTLQGVGAVDNPALQQRCPSCGPVPFNADACPRCGAAWPRGRPDSPTDRHNPALTRVRRHHRYAVQINVTYESEHHRMSGLASNLSFSGVFVNTSDVDPVGTSCRVTFMVAEGRRSFEGFVRHAIRRGVKGRVGMGIEFEALDAESTAWITQRLESWWRQDDRA